MTHIRHIKSPILSMLLNSARSDIQRLHAHPFNMGLRRGDLPFECFCKFLNQDKKYLSICSKVLKKIAWRYKPNDLDASIKIRAISDYISQTEINLLNKYLQSNLGNNFFQTNSTKNDAIKNYTNHLLESCSNASLPVAIASVLPCFILYNEMGFFMKSAIRDNNPYSLWIRSFSSERFSAHTKTLIDLLEDYNYSDKQELQQIIDAFVKSTHCEILFLDSIYQGAGTNAEQNKNIYLT